MKPHILKIDPKNIDDGLIEQAAETIRAKGLVAFPTETVYGLGANALDAEAVAGIFEAKERPLDDPLIVHIADIEDLHSLAAGIPPEADKLVDHFWPGPLTVVVEKTEAVPDIVTTGLSTVAIRMPSNEIAKTFIKAAGVPIAAPSANMFGRPSPTSAGHVTEDLNGRIDVILDGGPTEIGIESTVVEFIEGKTIILRPGGIDLESIRDIMGKVEVSSDSQRAVKSPGKYPQHYSPHARVLIIDNDPEQIDKVLATVESEKLKGLKTGIMATEEHAGKYMGHLVKVLGPSGDGRQCATQLFHLLREFDAENVDVIIAESIPEDGMGLAVMDRLRKAAGPDVCDT